MSGADVVLVSELKSVEISVIVAVGAGFSAVQLARAWARFFNAKPIQ